MERARNIALAIRARRGPGARTIYSKIPRAGRDSADDLKKMLKDQAFRAVAAEAGTVLARTRAYIGD